MNEFTACRISREDNRIGYVLDVLATSELDPGDVVILRLA